MKVRYALALLASVFAAAGFATSAQEIADQKAVQIPTVEEPFFESACGRPDPALCELRLLRAGSVVGPALVPLGSQFVADATGQVVVAVNANRAVRFRTVDMKVDRRISYPRALAHPSTVLVGPGANRIFMVVNSSVVILNIDGEEFSGAIDMKRRRSRLMVGLEAMGLAAAAAAVVVARPDALGEALAASSNRSATRDPDVSLALVRDGKDVKATYRPNGRVVLFDASAGTLLWDTHFRRR